MFALHDMFTAPGNPPAVRFSGAAGGVVSNGAPATHVGPAVSVPVLPPPDASAVVVPDPSFMCQRPTRPAVAPISVFIVDWIWLCERALLQMRASSI